MSVWRAIRSEYRFNFGHPKRLIPILAIFMIPILYAGTFLWAFWDPYGHLNRMPVAVVNDDRGATTNGQHIAAGQELVHQLQSNHDFDWRFVSDSQANSGLYHNQYFMVIKIPARFSQQAAKAATSPNPTQPKLVAITNDRYNYIASIIGKNAAQQLKEQIAQAIAKDYTTQLVKGLQQLEQGIRAAAGGANQVSAGANQLQQHANSLVQGAKQVSSGSQSLAKGTAQSATGASQVATGAQSVYQGTKQLGAGLGQLVTAGGSLSQGANGTLSGLQTLQSGVKQSTDAATQTATGANQLAAGMQQYLQAHPELANDAAFQLLLQTSESVATGASQLSSGQSQLVSGVAQLEQGQSSLTNGLDVFLGNLARVKSGSQTLLNQEPRLVTGAQQLAAGLGNLQTGAAQLQSGTSNLNSGVDQFSGGVRRLQHGTDQMASNLNQAQTKMPALHRKQLVSATSNPVGLTHVRQGDIENYGHGFAPYFLSLGLFVGALLMSIVISFRDPVEKPASALAWFLSKFVLVVSVSMAQALIADLVVLKGLGLHVGNPVHFVLFSLLTSFTFVAIVQFLVTSMANPGRFLALVLLILQLTSSSGTYPSSCSSACCIFGFGFDPTMRRGRSHQRNSMDNPRYNII